MGLLSICRLASPPGNRLATVLIYMEAVESGGGATVFPELGLAIKPRGGSAVFWYNLHRNK